MPPPSSARRAASRRFEDETTNRMKDALDLFEEVCDNRHFANVSTGAGQESEIPNFKASYLGRFPLVSADFWTSDHLSERSRSVDTFSGTRARGTLTLKRR